MYGGRCKKFHSNPTSASTPLQAYLFFLENPFNFQRNFSELPCMRSRPGTVVQEDKAPSHAHHYQEVVYNLAEVKRLLWCENSPDLNPIEPCWPWIKRSTTKKGAPESRAEGIRRWEATWKELPQEKIQAWIERIPWHIEQIIQLGGGNEHKQNRKPIVE